MGLRGKPPGINFCSPINPHVGAKADRYQSLYDIAQLEENLCLVRSRDFLVALVTKDEYSLMSFNLTKISYNAYKKTLQKMLC